MTRLQHQDIAELGPNLTAYEKRLRTSTGGGLADIASHALGMQPMASGRLLKDTVAAVIPVSYGEGLIPGFSEAVQGILEFLGCTAFVTEQGNIMGLGEAIERKATLLFLSDDDDFVAMNLATGRTSHNSEATGRGYGAALDLMAGGVDEREVLIIGAGPVGQAAARYLDARGGRVTVYDHDYDRARSLVERIPGGRQAPDLATALQRCSLIVEATPSADVLTRKDLTSRTMIAAPGVPLGVDVEGQAFLGRRLIHDALEIGVATMLYTALAPMTVGE